MSRLNRLYNAKKYYVIKCIRNGGIIYRKSVRAYSGLCPAGLKSRILKRLIQLIEVLLLSNKGPLEQYLIYNTSED